MTEQSGIATRVPCALEPPDTPVPPHFPSVQFRGTFRAVPEQKRNETQQNTQKKKTTQTRFLSTLLMITIIFLKIESCDITKPHPRQQNNKVTSNQKPTKNPKNPNKRIPTNLT